MNARGVRSLNATDIGGDAGYRDVCQYLLRHGARVSAKQDEGYTALMGAAEFGFASIAKSLLAHRASIMAKTNDGRRSPWPRRTATRGSCAF